MFANRVGFFLLEWRGIFISSQISIEMSILQENFIQSYLG